MLSLSHQFLRGIQLVWIYYTAKLYLFAKERFPQTYPVVGTAHEPTRRRPLPALERIALSRKSNDPSVEIGDYPRRNEKILRKFDLLLPKTHQITQFDCSSNAFTLDALPVFALERGKYLYAPQQELPLPKQIGQRELDFSSIAQLQGVLSAPVPTIFTWVSDDNKPLVEGKDFFLNGGKITFKEGVSSYGYFVMTTKAFPDFTGDKAYRTITTYVNNPVANQQIEEATSVRRVGNAVALEAPIRVTYCLYSLNGELLQMATLEAGEHTLLLPSDSEHYILHLGVLAYKI